MRISIIIPTLNEEACLKETLENLRQQSPHEIIIADGGSTDRTLKIARHADKVISSIKGRANQMNAGAAIATGDILLFLHADCQLEEKALLQVPRFLRRPSIVAGCFQMQVSETGALFRSIDYCATLRAKLFGMIYGDQGMFLFRSMFERAGKFPSVRFMEDVLLSRSLAKFGRIFVIPKKIYVSSRRWQKVGLVRQTLRNWSLTALASGGVHPDDLARYYPAVR